MRIAKRKKVILFLLNPLSILSMMAMLLYGICAYLLFILYQNPLDLNLVIIRPNKDRANLNFRHNWTKEVIDKVNLNEEAAYLPNKYFVDNNNFYQFEGLDQMYSKPSNEVLGGEEIDLIFTEEDINFLKSHYKEIQGLGYKEAFEKYFYKTNSLADIESFYCSINPQCIKKITYDLFSDSDRYISSRDFIKRFNQWIYYFTKKSKVTFIEHYKNGKVHEERVKKILISNKIPTDLFYVAFIESGFQTTIMSQAKAKGVWQFLEKTGRYYGLKIEGDIDERENLRKSTEAASKYFLDLYNYFADWKLALMAYNVGEYRVLYAIRKAKSRKIEDLAQSGDLPEETKNYLPKIMAVKYLYHKYNLTNDQFDQKLD